MPAPKAEGRRLSLVVIDPAWRRLVPAPVRYLAPFSKAAVAAAGGPAGPITLALADDASVRPLNARFRGKDRPTNVLSFPAVGGGGDVILARETIAAEAAAQGKSPAHHAAHLVVHGILHLFGYDHRTRGQARRMERLEKEILARFGLPDPYA